MITSGLRRKDARQLQQRSLQFENVHEDTPTRHAFKLSIREGQG